MHEVPLRHVGTSGLLVSAVGLGCNNFGRRLGPDASVAVIHAALDAGITLFDTADIYGDGASEEILGRALGDRRAGVVVATKFSGPRGASPYERGGSRRWIRLAVERSLQRLRCDWIDLYQMHFPDPETPIAETLETLDDLVHEGKVRYIGSSQFAGWQIADAEWTARTGGWEHFISAQNQYSLIHRDIELEVTPACARYGLGIIPFYPLAAGMLTGKYQRGVPPPQDTRLGRVPDLAAEMLTDSNFDAVDRLRHFAETRGRSLLDVAVAGLGAQPHVASVIAGATTPDQVRANAAAGSWVMSADDVAELNALAPSR